MSTGASVIRSFVTRSGSSASARDFARLEQAYKSTSAKTANLNDLYQMLARTKSGLSAMDYVYEQCPYARIDDTVLTVTLDFYVWVSNLDLAYNLSSGVGDISDAVALSRPRSFDLIFDHSDSESLVFLFEGTFDQEMPFFDEQGRVIISPEVTVKGSVVSLSTAGTGVLRAVGVAHGFKHTLTMQLSEKFVTSVNSYAGKVTELAGYALENLETSVTVSWMDAEGKVQSNILEIVLPPCIEDLVTMCGGDNTNAYMRIAGDGESYYIVYYSTCDGSVLRSGWEKDK